MRKFALVQDGSVALGSPKILGIFLSLEYTEITPGMAMKSHSVRG